MNKKPNILIVLAEDICPNLGCYGDKDALTPNLDKLASEGVRYDNATSCAPVCSAARTSLVLGTYPSSLGVGNHRSYVKLPEKVKVIGKYMSELGYYTGINKTDFNFEHKVENGKIEGFDSVIPGAFFGDDSTIAENLAQTWRKSGDKPFFMIHTFACTHQSRYGFPNNPQKHREEYAPRTKESEFRDRSSLNIPKYHPDTPQTREIWGQYHEQITAMDRCFGEVVEHLKNEGIYDDTIIIFAGDNGMGIPGGKANMWDEGVHVPMIVRVPEKFAHLAKNIIGKSVQKSGVSFVDIAPTCIRLAGGEIPEYMSGKDFLNENNFDEYTYCFRNRIDSISEFVRVIRSENFIYIRNFFPHRGWRFSSYMARMSPYFTVAWENNVKGSDDFKEYTRKNAFFLPEKPIEELYDLKNDSEQMINLAENPIYNAEIKQMRKLMREFILSNRDLGFAPEQELENASKIQGKTVYEVTRDEKYYPLEKLYDFHEKMVENRLENNEILQFLTDENQIVRFWGIQAINYYKNSDFIEELINAFSDENMMVRFASAEALLNLSEKCDYLALSKSVLKDMIETEGDVLVSLAVADLLHRLAEKTSDLLGKANKMLTAENHYSQVVNERYFSSVSDVLLYNSELLGEYVLDEQKFDERLDILHDLRLFKD